ncbi:hypothetical protein KYC5002_21700 [Archangium violaceum]|uniref:hypothetical protein n=1 Tax=Archangium violaceum TaxID=83451 RepID=UPI002B28B85E|nr:hypothetical protein KYC5002_21700 [Archangium gephyra]
MKEQRITIEIDAEGRLSADVEGFEGDTCLRELEKLLAGCASAWERVERKPDTKSVRVTSQQKVGLGKKP